MESPFQNLISDYVEELSFLWNLWQTGLILPNYTPQDIANIKKRIAAHFEGIQLSGNESVWELCLENLATPRPGEVFSASLYAFDKQDREKVDLILKTVEKNPETAEAVIGVFHFIPYAHTEPFIRDFLTSDSALIHMIGFSALALYNLDPAPYLAKALAGQHAQACAKALQIIADLKIPIHTDAVLKLITHADDHCRLNAGLSLTALKYPTGPEVLFSFARQESPFTEKALKTLIPALSPESAQNFVDELKQNKSMHRHALYAAGLLGQKANLPFVFEAMTHINLARKAGQAFTMITGIDIALEPGLEGDMPKDYQPMPNDDPEDENIGMDPDEGLVWPHVENIMNHWKNKT